MHILPEMEELPVYYRLPLTVADQERQILSERSILYITLVILLILNAAEKTPVADKLWTY